MMCVRTVFGLMLISGVMPRLTILPSLDNSTSHNQNHTNNESLIEEPTYISHAGDTSLDMPDNPKEINKVISRRDVETGVPEDGARGTRETSKTVPTRRGQVVKCECGPQEVLTSGGCQLHPTDVYLDNEGSFFGTTRKSMTDVNVIVRDLHCEVDNDHQEMNFTKGQFYLRDRGDIVLLDAAGYLSGLRINNYCVIHHLDDDGELTWMMKACIPPPSVPRCCLPDEALIGTVCRPAHTPKLLTPPIAAGPRKNPIEWPVIRNHHNPLSCTQHPMKTLPLTSVESQLIAIPTGIIHMWDLPGEHTIKYSFPTNFCVDGQLTHDGSVRYTANLCYSDPKEIHHKTCEGNICVRKCCEYGQILDTSLHRCVASDNITFIPPFVTKPSKYKTVIGMALCSPQSELKNFTLAETGYVTYLDTEIPPTDYCLDTFFDGLDKYEIGGIGCVVLSTRWDKVRSILFPICQVISLVFLSFTVVCYCKVPELLRHDGWHLLCYIISLILAFSSNLFQQFLTSSMNDTSCVVLALIMQFGYLATFFWLSVLCFDIWKKIRSLARYIPLYNVSFWVYPLYAFGGPFIIGIMTGIMQFLAPDNVPGIIKPYLGVTRCWFVGELELLSYFYGPIGFLFVCNIIFIALTYWDYRMIKNKSNSDLPCTDNNSALRTSLVERHRKQNYFSDFKQQFSLLALMSFCWVTEIISWKVPPPELWAITDILNSLQGFFIMLIFMANASKRKHLKKKYPGIFKAEKQFFLPLQRIKSFILCKKTDDKEISLTVQ